VETNTNCIRNAAKEVLGESKGKIHYNKETWRWSVEVQEAAREKRHYKVRQGTRNIENYEMCKAKKVVSDANCKAYDELYNRLGTRRE